MMSKDYIDTGIAYYYKGIPYPTKEAAVRKQLEEDLRIIFGSPYPIQWGHPATNILYHLPEIIKALKKYEANT